MTATLMKTTHSMGLKKFVRNRCPIDGSWFQATANLNSILRAATNYRDADATWPTWASDVRVPVWISMRLYKGGESRLNPSGMRYGPVIKVGTFDSPEIEMFGNHHAAGLSYDDTLRGDWANEPADKWLYTPYGYHNEPAPGQDASYYECGNCGKTLYRDERGERSHNSATIFKGTLVCRDCEVTGLVMDGDAEKQLKRCYALANHIGGGLPDRLARQIDQLARDTYFGSPAQTRIWREDKYSFNWGITVFNEEGKKQGMHGGLIQHGPHPIETGVDGYTFRTWDYTLKAERDATPEEVAGIHWSIHT